jgi:hypothetical protein
MIPQERLARPGEVPWLEWRDRRSPNHLRGGRRVGTGVLFVPRLDHRLNQLASDRAHPVRIVVPEPVDSPAGVELETTPSASSKSRNPPECGEPIREHPVASSPGAKGSIRTLEQHDDRVEPEASLHTTR